MAHQRIQGVGQIRSNPVNRLGTAPACGESHAVGPRFLEGDLLGAHEVRISSGLTLFNHYLNQQATGIIESGNEGFPQATPLSVEGTCMMEK
jgi:hypothetical protein